MYYILRWLRGLYLPLAGLLHSVYTTLCSPLAGLLYSGEHKTQKSASGEHRQEKYLSATIYERITNSKFFCVMNHGMLLIRLIFMVMV